MCGMSRKNKTHEINIEQINGEKAARLRKLKRSAGMEPEPKGR
jgi:hypothetical protein